MKTMEQLKTSSEPEERAIYRQVLKSTVEFGSALIKNKAIENLGQMAVNVSRAERKLKNYNPFANENNDKVCSIPKQV